MMNLITDINAAIERGTALRPKVGGFPYFAESLRQAGVRSYRFDVVSSSVVYVTDDGAVLRPGALPCDDWTEIASFDESMLVNAIRADQHGESTFADFIGATFAAGVISYHVDTQARTCTYLGARGERYVEDYPAVDLPVT